MFFQMASAFSIGLGLTWIAYPYAIKFLRRLKFGQEIREDGPQSHLAKSGTPTMGGIVFILTSLASIFIVGHEAFENTSFLIVVLAFVGYGIIGFIDDFLIVVKKNNDGLKPIYKFLLQ